MSKKYTHYFDVRLSNSFESDTEDFYEAFDAWCAFFQDISALRTALLCSYEGTKSLLQGVIYGDTFVIEETSAPAPAGESDAK